MTNVAESPAEMTLTAAQSAAADALRECERGAAEHRAHLHKLSDELRILEEVLPVKRAAVARAEAEYEVIKSLLREHFSLYRDLMNLSSPDQRQ